MIWFYHALMFAYAGIVYFVLSEEPGSGGACSDNSCPWPRD